MRARKDTEVECPECGRRIRQGNLGRHVKAKHPNSPTADAIRQEVVREMIGPS